MKRKESTLPSVIVHLTLQTPQKIVFLGSLPKRQQRIDVFEVHRPVVICVEGDISLYSCRPFVDVGLDLFELKV